MPEALALAGVRDYLRQLSRRLGVPPRHLGVTWQVWRVQMSRTPFFWPPDAPWAQKVRRVQMERATSTSSRWQHAGSAGGPGSPVG